MLKIITTVILFSLVINELFAQNVGIGTNLPDASAKLEIQSTDKGLLIPRVSIPNLLAAAPVTTPAVSLLVYNTNATTGQGYYYWDGTQWVKLLNQNDVDHDWYEVGTTIAPDAINDNIYTQGNVGIGTNTPDQRLEITGGGVQINGLGGIGFQSELPVSGTATRDGYRVYYDNNLFGSAFDGIVFEKTDFNAPTPDGGIAFANMGNTNIREIAMVIRGNNRVGIGTTTPNNILQLGTPGAPTDAFQDGLFINDTDGPIIRMRSLGSSEFFIENPAVASSNRLYFRPGNLTNNPTMALVANDVGIGTTAPVGQLHILNTGGSHYFNGQLFRTTRLISGQQYGLQLQHDAARTYFNTINNSGTPTTRMVIQSVNGFIGMGTTVPTEKLDVVGATRIREISLGTAATDTILVADITGVIKKKDANSLGLVVQDSTEWRDAGNFIVARDAEAAGNDVVVTDAGHVGIGTNNPNVGKLQVRQSADNSNSGMTVTNAASSTGLRMWVDATNKGRIDASAGGGADLIINSTGTGDVGIGTTAPTSKLHVENGNIFSRSNTFNIHEARSNSNNLSQGPHFIGTRSGGTGAAPTHPANDAVMVTVQGRNALNAGFVGSGITIRTSENHSATNQGSDMFFATVNNGSTAAANRMVIKNDGKIGVGIMDSDARLHVASGGNGAADYTAKFTSSPSVGGSGGIVFTNTESPVATGFKWHTVSTGTNTFADDQLILSSVAVTSGATNRNNIINLLGNGNIGFGALANTGVYINTATGARLTNGGAWANSSDRRLKTNIINSKYGLATILSLRPVDYTMIKSEEKQVGFIAQEVQEIVPEAVYGTEGDLEKNETLSLSYDQLVPVLTKAIQEQQEMIEKQNQAIKVLQKELQQLKNK